MKPILDQLADEMRAMRERPGSRVRFESLSRVRAEWLAKIEAASSGAVPEGYELLNEGPALKSMRATLRVIEASLALEMLRLERDALGVSVSRMREAIERGEFAPEKFYIH